MPELTATPYYSYNHQQAVENISCFEALIKAGAQIFYAVKSNNHEPLVKEIIKQGLGFDVATKEELEYVIGLGADVKKIVFAAPSKRPADIEYAKKVGVRALMFDSSVEVEKILSIYKDEEVDLVLRIESQKARASFNLSDKFGVSVDDAKQLLKMAHKLKWPVIGVTYHVGSQNIDIDAWDNTLERALELIQYGNSLGLKMNYIDIGGGVPAKYDDSTLPIHLYTNRLAAMIRRLRKEHPEISVAIEPGRSIGASTMKLFTSVIDIKPYKVPNFIIVDTGTFNGIIEPLEHFEYPISLSRRSSAKAKKFNVAGFTCEGYDVIAHNVDLPGDIKVGDVLCIDMAGAYTFVYEKFHMVGYPQIINET